MAARVWYITGCSSGFGRAIARKVLESGERVVATARRAEALADLAAEFGDAVLALSVDVTDPREVEDSLAAGHGHFGQLDVVLNNAGYGLIGALEEVTEEEIRANFEVNVMGPIRVIRAALPILRGQKRGHLVTISAAAAIGNYAGFSIYGGGKAMLEGIHESLAQELRPLGIRVTLVQPGPFRTEFIGRGMAAASGRIEDYNRTVARFHDYLRKMDGKQPGDPARAADAIRTIVDSDNPPLRLVLGTYATDKVRKKAAAVLKELDEWEAIGRHTEFEAAPV